MNAPRDPIASRIRAHVSATTPHPPLTSTPPPAAPPTPQPSDTRLQVSLRETCGAGRGARAPERHTHRVGAPLVPEGVENVSKRRRDATRVTSPSGHRVGLQGPWHPIPTCRPLPLDSGLSEGPPKTAAGRCSMTLVVSIMDELADHLDRSGPHHHVLTAAPAARYGPTTGGGPPYGLMPCCEPPWRRCGLMTSTTPVSPYWPPPGSTPQRSSGAPLRPAWRSPRPLRPSAARGRQARRRQARPAPPADAGASVRHESGTTRRGSALPTQPARR